MDAYIHDPIHLWPHKAMALYSYCPPLVLGTELGAKLADDERRLGGLTLECAHADLLGSALRAEGGSMP